MDEVINLIIEKIKEEWILAGHPTTGSFIDSLEGNVTKTGKDIKLEVWANEYGHYMNKGVTADKVPYTPKKRGQGSGGTSKYITGLNNWVQLKLGVGDEREATSIALAIAQKHSINGIPGSGFLDKMVEQYEKEIEEMFLEKINNEIEKWL